MTRDGGTNKAVAEGEAVLRMLLSGLPDGVKAAKLDWKSLAEHGQVKQLYGFHRALSGRSSHVTGLSILPDFALVDGTTEKQDELNQLTKRMHLMMMAGATLQGSLMHSQMIDNQALFKTAKSLVDRMNELSEKWPKVQR